MVVVDCARLSDAMTLLGRMSAAVGAMCCSAPSAYQISADSPVFLPLPPHFSESQVLLYRFLIPLQCKSQGKRSLKSAMDSVEWPEWIDFEPRLPHDLCLLRVEQRQHKQRKRYISSSYSGICLTVRITSTSFRLVDCGYAVCYRSIVRALCILINSYA